MKEHYRSFLLKVPGGKWVYRITRNMKEWLKRVLLPTTFFETMGFNYLGPVDGHDVESLISLLRTVRDHREPILIHVVTQKGRGYKFAEESPSRFHGIGSFDPESGVCNKNSTMVFSEAFGEGLMDLAKEDLWASKTIVVLLPDTGERYLSTPMFDAT